MQDGNVRKKEEEETQREQEQREAETHLKKNRMIVVEVNRVCSV